jgi:hypothetical protein
MKIIISETQLSRLVKEAAPLSPEELDQRIGKAKELAVNYKNPRQFALAHPQLWNTIRAFNKLDDVFPKRRLYNPEGFWTAENIAKESIKYDSRSAFLKGNQVAYNRANELGIMDDLFPEKNKTRKPNYDLDKAIEIAKEFTGTRSDFIKTHSTAYRLLKMNDLLHAYLPEKKLANPPIPHGVLLDKAKQYSTITDLLKNDKYLYIQLKQRALIDDLYPYSLKIQNLLDIAKKYENKYELKKHRWREFKKLEKLNLFGVAYPKLSLSNLAKDINQEED